MLKAAPTPDHMACSLLPSQAQEWLTLNTPTCELRTITDGILQMKQERPGKDLGQSHTARVCLSHRVSCPVMPPPKDTVPRDAAHTSSPSRQPPGSASSFSFMHSASCSQTRFPQIEDAVCLQPFIPAPRESCLVNTTQPDLLLLPF